MLVVKLLSQLKIQFTFEFMINQDEIFYLVNQPAYLISTESRNMKLININNLGRTVIIFCISSIV